MMSVTQGSVKSAFCMQNLGVCQSQGKFSYSFVINCHFDRILNLFFIFLLEANCLQLDSNLIAIKIGLRHFSDITQFFTNNWPPSWTPSWIYRNAQ